MKKKESAVVLFQKELVTGIFDMWLETSLAYDAKPGQFICIYPKDRSILLPRPLSICEISRDKTALRLVYRLVGQGTREFSKYEPEDRIEIMGALGNGFPLEDALGKRALLIGGGIGIPPLLQLAKELTKPLHRSSENYIVAGYRDHQLFLDKDLKQYGNLYIATEDGSIDTRGNVLDAIAANHLKGDVIYACGPLPMLKAVKGYAAEKGIKAYISLEEHMACGVGACLGCVRKYSRPHTGSARICTEGPVFDAQEVEIE